MEKSTRELEWFDLEIKTREVIHQQLNPVLSKAREDRESFMNLKNYCAKLEKRIHELEVSVLGDKPQETVIANIYELCAKIEGERKKDCVRIDQEIANLHEKLKTLNFSIEKAHEEILCIKTKDDATEIELKNIKNINEENKQMILEEIANLDVRFKELNMIYKEVSIKSEERSITAINKSHANNLEMGNYKREIENIRKQHLEALTMIREVKANKIEEVDYNANLIKTDSRFLELNEQIGFFKDELYHRDRFIDKFIPLQTATMISDYLHGIMELPYKKRLAEFESIILLELNNQTISSEPIESREIRVQKILDQMKHMEERKAQLLTDIKPKEAENQPKQKKNASKKRKETQEPTVIENIYHSGPDLTQIEKMIDDKINPLQNYLLKIIQEDINVKQEATKSYFKAIIQENNSLLNQVIQDFEENSKQYKKEASSITKDIGAIKTTVDEIKKSGKGFDNSLVNLTRMVVCLVENAQIEQALEAQDEEDRHSMVQSYEKDLQSDLVLTKPRGSPEPYSSALPSGIAIQKKCLGCGNNNSMISGFRTTVMYKPTPLLYRNKKFERPNLINFRGRMVKDCWEEVSQHIPWRQEDMENLVTETYKNMKIIISTTDDDISNLPILNSATRNRSYHNRKMRFNKISM